MSSREIMDAKGFIVEDDSLDFRDPVVKRVVEIINSVGSPKIIIKSDQEPAIVDLQKEVRKELWDEILEISSMCSSELILIRIVLFEPSSRAFEQLECNRGIG